MRVVVFGAGAVGGHFAARLAAHGPAAGIEVAAVARGAQLEAMNRVQAFARTAGIAAPNLDAITALVIQKARRMGLYAPAVW